MDKYPGMCYPLQLEIIHRRRTNGCRSLFYRFWDDPNPINNSSVNRTQSFSELLGFNESYVEEFFFDSIEEQINKEISINSMSSLFLQGVNQEYHHLYNLIKLASESIESDDFTLSKLTDGYHFSLQFLNNTFEEYLKEKLMSKFYYIDNRIPKDSFDVNKDLTNLITTTFRFTEIISSDKWSDYIQFGIFISKISLFIKDNFTHPNNQYGKNGITLPTWLLQYQQLNFNNKLDTFLSENTEYSDTEEITNLINDLTIYIQNHYDFTKKELLKYFK